MLKADAMTSYDEFLDALYECISINEYTFKPSEVLRCCHPSAYHQGLVEWCRDNGVELRD